MKKTAFQVLATCAVSLLLAGCFAPPKPHPWEITHADAMALQNARFWSILSTNFYQRVPDNQNSNAVLLLKDVPFVHLDPQQMRLFAPDLHVTSENLQPYLVRGACYCLTPYFTELRFDEIDSNLLVQQITYDGEILMPFRWVSEPDALVAFLPRAPNHVYVQAVLGGDFIFARWGNSDTR